jgi:hypothetical protein
MEDERIGHIWVEANVGSFFFSKANIVLWAATLLNGPIAC